MSAAVIGSYPFSSGSSNAPAVSGVSQAAGDVLLAIISSNEAVAATDNNWATPFTASYSVTRGDAESTLTVLTRVVHVGDPTTWTFALGAATRVALVLVVVRGADASIFDVTPASAEAIGTSINAPSITTLTANALHFVCCGIDNNATSTGQPAGYTVEQNIGQEGLTVCDKTIASPSATGAQTFTTASNSLLAISFAIKTTVPAIDQEGYRWRDDDASESAAAWLASQDTDITRASLTNTRLRAILNATGDPASAGMQLEYMKSSGGVTWHVVPTTAL